MKAGILFANTGPILVLTSCASFQEPVLLHQLAGKGITKFIAYEIDLATVQAGYGMKLDIALGDLHQTDVLRVLDVGSQSIFNHFHLDELGEPITVEIEQMESHA